MKSFWIRTVNLLVILGILACYHMTVEVRHSRDEAARLSAELEQAKVRLEAKTDDDRKADDGAYRDGVYTGEALGFGGMISLEVTIGDGRIEDISILSASGEDAAYLAMAKSIISSILEKQSADVDTISGATFSSTGIKNAVDEALKSIN